MDEKQNSYRRRLSFCKDLSGVLLNHIIILISEEGEMGGGGGGEIKKKKTQKPLFQA